MTMLSTSNISVAPEGLDELPEVFGHFLGKCHNSGLKFILIYIVDHHFFAGALLLRFHFNMPLLSIDSATSSFFTQHSCI